MKLGRRVFIQAATAGLVLSAVPPAARAAAEASEKLKVGILGSGRIGSAYARAWANAGHEVMLSSLDLEHDRKLAASIGPNARAGTPREAIVFGDIVLIAVPYRALPRLGKDMADVIKGKKMIDAANPFPSPERDGELGAWAREKGPGFATQELLPGARLVRAFNAVGAVQVPDIAARNPRVGMPMASDDQKAYAVASRLARDVGFEPVLVGGLVMGKYLIPGTPLAGVRTAEEIRK